MAVLKVFCPEEDGAKRDLYKKTYKMSLLLRGIVLGLTVLCLFFAAILPSNKIDLSVKDAEGNVTWTKTYKESPVGTLVYFISNIGDMASNSGKSEEELLEKALEGLTEEQKNLPEVEREVIKLRDEKFSQIERMENTSSVIGSVKYSHEIDMLGSKLYIEGMKAGLLKDAATEEYNKAVEENTALRYKQVVQILDLFLEEVEVGNVAGVNMFIVSVKEYAKANGLAASIIEWFLSEKPDEVKFDEAALTKIKEKVVEDKLADKYLVGEYEITEELIEKVVRISESEYFENRVCTNPWNMNPEVKTTYDEFDTTLRFLYNRDGVDEENTKFYRTQPAQIGGDEAMVAVCGLVMDIIFYMLLILTVIGAIKYLLSVLSMPNSMKTKNIIRELLFVVLPLLGIILGTPGEKAIKTFAGAAASVSVLNVFALIFAIGALAAEIYCNITIKKLNKELQK